MGCVDVCIYSQNMTFVESFCISLYCGGTHAFCLLFAWAAMCFYLLHLHVRAHSMGRPVFLIERVVDPWYYTMSNRLIMHKHAFRKIFTAWIPCYTFWTTTATNSIMLLSFEPWIRQDVISWKAGSVKKSHLHVEQNDVLSWERGKEENCRVRCEANFLKSVYV